jgi:hypothetical protein
VEPKKQTTIQIDESIYQKLCRIHEDLDGTYSRKQILEMALLLLEMHSKNKGGVNRE